MIDFDAELRARRLITLFFAFLTSAFVVSTAVAPAILHF